MDHTSQRLDTYVTEQLQPISRAHAAKLIASGEVLVNGERAFKASHKLKSSDQVTILRDPAQAGYDQSVKLAVFYEDKDCVVLDKPAGVLTHSKGAFNPEATVATWLQQRAPAMTGERAGIVHRLDRATSGVMICAKTPEALSWLQKQFAQRRTKKTYVAVVRGRLKTHEAIIDMPIERNPKRPQTFRAGSNGKPAQTTYKVMQSNDIYTMVELKPYTGRTHQLRVHLKELGHPIVGDKLYNGEPAGRLYLHARELELTLPNRCRQDFASPLPPEFMELLGE